MYVCNRVFIIFVCIFGTILVSNFSNVIAKIVFRYDANEISKCFAQHVLKKFLYLNVKPFRQPATVSILEHFRNIDCYDITYSVDFIHHDYSRNYTSRAC